jgi:hypothetical protein
LELYTFLEGSTVNKQSKQNHAPWRAIARKPVLVLALLLIFVAVLSVAVQADEVNNEDKRPDLFEPTIVSQTSGPEGTNVVVTLPVAQDAFLSSANPDTPYGLWTTLRLGYDQSTFQALRFMLQWDMSIIPPNSVINNATASIYQFSVTPPGDTLRVQGQYVTAQWYENSVTWNNANYLGGDITQVGDINSALGWKSVNVTDIVRTWYSGARPNYGTILTADETPASNRSRIFYSRQQPGFQPFVTLDYTIACDNVPPVASVNPLPSFSPASFQVTWSGTDYAPSGCTPVGIAYYDVQYKADGGNWVSWINQTTSTSATFEGGQNNVYYEFRTRAVDYAGNVQEWTATQATTRVDTQPPIATVNPLPEYILSDNFILTWSGTDNLSGIQNYDVQYKVGDGPWLLGLQQTTLTSYHVTGVQDGVTYYFRARATDNVNNLQPWSSGAQAQTTVTTAPRSTILPFQPAILKPTDPITDSFRVRWEGETAAGWITNYRIYFWYNNPQDWTLWGDFPGTETSRVFEYMDLGLGDGRYGFEVVATNNLGQPETRNFVAEQVMIVDLADAIVPVSILPLLADQTTIE